MRHQSTQALLNQAIQTPRETPSKRTARQAQSVAVARQMLNNGCTANEVARYTGLKEDVLRKL